MISRIHLKYDQINMNPISLGVFLKLDAWSTGLFYLKKINTWVILC